MSRLLNILHKFIFAGFRDRTTEEKIELYCVHCSGPRLFRKTMYEDNVRNNPCSNCYAYVKYTKNRSKSNEK